MGKTICFHSGLDVKETCVNYENTQIIHIKMRKDNTQSEENKLVMRIKDLKKVTWVKRS